MVRTLQAIGAHVALAFVAATPVLAGTHTASFQVSARVVARTWIEPVDEPATVLLTQADVAQGFKMLDVRYRVHATGTSRFLLNIAPRIGLAHRIDIEGLGAAVSLGSTDITVLQQALAKVNELRLRLRLELLPGVPPGHYAMPVRLSVSAS